MSISLIKSLKLQNNRAWAIDFISQGNILAVASEDHKIKLVKITDPDKKQFKLLSVLDETVHKKTVRSVAWRPHSNPPSLAAGSFDATVSIWSSIPGEFEEDDEPLSNADEDMELLAIIEGHEHEIKGVSWSHDGIFLATCSRDKSVWIWETDEAGEDFECVSVLQEHSQDVKHVSWHPYKYLLASSSYDDTIRLWGEFDDDWECVAVLNGHEGTVWSSDFEKNSATPDSIRLCSGSDDSTVRVWKYQGEDPDGQQEWVCESQLPKVHKRQIYSVSWGANGLIASTGSDGALVVYKETQPGEWEIIAQKELSHQISEVNEVKWISVNGKDLLVTSGDDGCINLWNLTQ